MCVNQILPEIHAAVEGGKLTERNVHVYFEGIERHQLFRLDCLRKTGAGVCAYK